MNARERLATIHSGHAHIHQDRVVAVLVYSRHRRSTVIRLNTAPAPLFQQRTEHIAMHLIVIHHQNCHRIFFHSSSNIAIHAKSCSLQYLTDCVVVFAKKTTCLKAPVIYVAISFEKQGKNLRLLVHIQFWNFPLPVKLSYFSGDI